MQRIQFVSDSKGELTVTDPDEVSTYFRYPDLTAQCVYLANTLRATIQYDLSEELLFLERYDELKRELQQLIDMPDKRLDDIIVFLHQNKGIFPNRRKNIFRKSQRPNSPRWSVYMAKSSPSFSLKKSCFS